MNKKDFDDLFDKLSDVLTKHINTEMGRLYKMVVIFLSVITLFFAGILVFTLTNSIRIGEDSGNITALKENAKLQNDINKKQEEFNVRMVNRQNRLDSCTLKKTEYTASAKLINLKLEYLIYKENGASNEELIPIKNEIRQQQHNVSMAGIDVNMRSAIIIKPSETN